MFPDKQVKNSKMHRQVFPRLVFTLHMSSSIEFGPILVIGSPDPQVVIGAAIPSVVSNQLLFGVRARWTD